MGAGSKIAWTDDTFNPWWGCTKVSPGCARCYAEALDKRVGGDHFGQGQPRRTFGEKHWAGPLRWDRQAAEAGRPRFVFSGSMCDVFDEEGPEAERDRLWKLIEATPHLTWLLLTKRPENHEMVPLAWQTGTRRPANVWFGATAEDQKRLDERVPGVMEAPWPAVRFISWEPALGPLDFLHVAWPGQGGHMVDVFRRGFWSDDWGFVNHSDMPLRISWVIAGGESGAHARPMDEAWVRAVRDQCLAEGADVAFFYKQRWETGRKVEMPLLDGVRYDVRPGQTEAAPK